MARSADSVQADLDAVNSAILTRLQGGAVASMSIGGRSYSFASLTELRELKLDLEAELEDAQGTSVILADLRDRGL